LHHLNSLYAETVRLLNKSITYYISVQYGRGNLILLCSITLVVA